MPYGGIDGIPVSRENAPDGSVHILGRDRVRAECRRVDRGYQRRHEADHDEGDLPLGVPAVGHRDRVRDVVLGFCHRYR